MRSNGLHVGMRTLDIGESVVHATESLQARAHTHGRISHQSSLTQIPSFSVVHSGVW